MNKIKKFFRRFNNPLFRVIFIIIVIVVLSILYFGGKKINELINNKPKIQVTEEQAQKILTDIAPPEQSLSSKEVEKRLELLKKLKSRNSIK